LPTSTWHCSGAVAVVHLDLTADDLAAAEQRALALGAALPEQPATRWRVLLDPAGHPFCLTPFTPDSVAWSA
jgi:hypothetical protein